MFTTKLPGQQRNSRTAVLGDRSGTPHRLNVHSHFRTLLHVVCHNTPQSPPPELKLVQVQLELTSQKAQVKTLSGVRMMLPVQVQITIVVGPCQPAPGFQRTSRTASGAQGKTVAKAEPPQRMTRSMPKLLEQDYQSPLSLGNAKWSCGSGAAVEITSMQPQPGKAATMRLQLVRAAGP